MGGKASNRQPRLGSVRHTPPGWVRFAICNSCGHRGVLPAEALIRKLGEMALVEFALMQIRCTACDNYGASATMERLCTPGCPNRRTPASMAAE